MANLDDARMMKTTVQTDLKQLSFATLGPPCALAEPGEGGPRPPSSHPLDPGRDHITRCLHKSEVWGSGQWLIQDLPKGEGGPWRARGVRA